MSATRTGTMRTKGNSRSKFATRSRGKARRTQMTTKKRKQVLAEPDVIHMGPMDADEDIFAHNKPAAPAI
ncbi:MAG TPA: hypothetical protein VKX17_01985 [Planctomycetota bacterium]|nr:hypothetical protein [Planctomycetota bacterium]